MTPPLSCKPQQWGGARGFRYACNLCNVERTFNRAEIERHLMVNHGYTKSDARAQVTEAFEGREHV